MPTLSGRRRQFHHLMFIRKALLVFACIGLPMIYARRFTDVPKNLTTKLVNVPPPAELRRNLDTAPDWVRMWGPSGIVDYGFSRRTGENAHAEIPRPDAMQDEDNYDNIRIQVVFGDSDASDDDWTFVQEKLMPWTQAYLKALLKVYPVSGTLYAPRTCYSAWMTDGGPCARAVDDDSETCGDYGTIPAEHLGALTVYDGYLDVDTDLSKSAGSGGFSNTDLIMFITAKATEDCGESTLAYAGGCRYDQYDRTVVGYANFCPDMIDSSDEGWEEQWSTGVHEIMHAMGFSSSRFAYFWDHATGNPVTTRTATEDANPSGVPAAVDNTDAESADNLLSDYPGGEIYKPSTDTLQSFTERGQTVWKITSPTVLAKARAHFDCSTLNGAEIEDEGGAGTAGDHWEQRIFHDEAMTGVGRHAPTMSEITLAYFYDSGWYTVDYTQAGTLIWGKDAGCDFAMSECLTAGSSPTIVSGGEEQFCTTVGQKGCDHQHIGISECSITESGLTIPSYNQYWTDATDQGGSYITMNFCPAMGMYSDADCRFSSNQPQSNTGGETYGSDSRCFDSTIKTSGTNSWNAGCYKYECTDDELNVWMVCPDGVSDCTDAWLTCPTDGGELTIPDSFGFDSAGSFTCPSFASLCATGYHLGFGPPTSAPALDITSISSSTPSTPSSPTSPTSSTPSSPTSPTPAPTEGTFTVQQTITFSGLSEYDADTEAVYNVAYGISVGVYDTQGGDYYSGFQVESSAARRGMDVTFVTVGPETSSSVVSSNAEALESSPETFVDAVADANTALSKSVTAPDPATMTVAPASTSTSTSASPGNCRVDILRVLCCTVLMLVFLGQSSLS